MRRGSRSGLLGQGMIVVSRVGSKAEGQSEVVGYQARSFFVRRSECQRLQRCWWGTVDRKRCSWTGVLGRIWSLIGLRAVREFERRWGASRRRGWPQPAGSQIRVKRAVLRRGIYF